MKTDVSVIIPAYNRAGSISQAIDSVLGQSVAVNEILVVDDASDDDLAGALTTYGTRIRLLRHTANRGAAAARNTGVQAATSRYVAFLDSDDRWTPEKLERQLEFMEERDLDAACTNFLTVADEGAGADRPRPAYRPYPELLELADMSWGCFISPGATLVCRRELLVEVGGFDTALSRYEDWDLFLRLCQRPDFRLGFLAEPLAIISVGVHFHNPVAEDALRTLANKHAPTFAGGQRPLRRRFRSALLFARASLAFVAGRRPRMLALLLASWLLHPLGHWPLRVIVLPRLGFSGRSADSRAP